MVIIFNKSIKPVFFNHISVSSQPAVTKLSQDSIHFLESQGYKIKHHG